MKITLFTYCLCLGFFIVFSPELVATQPTSETEEAEDEEEQDDEWDDYDPENENDINPCRRNPTWKGVDGTDYTEMCSRLTEWSPRDYWWRKDPKPTQDWLPDGRDVKIAECLDESFRSVPDTHWWAECNEKDRTDACYVDEQPVVTAHYAHIEEGDIVTIRNVLSEQEAYGLESLTRCMREYLPDELPFFEQQAVSGAGSGNGDESDENITNRGTLLAAMLQMYLPGVAASITHAAQEAYDQSDWVDMDLPAPNVMGLRAVQLSEYRKTGRLGLQAGDRGSLFTISVALSDEDDYEGGFFTLQSDHAIFKVARRSAIIYFSETSNSITPVKGGVRQTLEVEFWEEDDVPMGQIRPTLKGFEAYRLARGQELGLTQTTGDEL